MTCAAVPLASHIGTGMPFRRESIEREFLEGKTAVSPATSASRYEDTVFSSSFCSSQSTSTLSSSRENSPSSKAAPQPTTPTTATTTTTPITDANANAAAAVNQAHDHSASSKQAARPRPEPIRTGHPFTSQILSPRPYEQIYAEMSYLTGSLHSEALKTAKLIGHYSLIEEALRGEAAVGKHRRRLRKQLSSLKCRTAQASLQEKAIRVRLSELQMEAQSRTTWIQLQQRRVVPDAGPLSAAAAERGYSAWARGAPGGCMTAGGGTTASPSAAPKRKLNAACLEFVPGRIVCADGAGDRLRNRGLEYHFERRDGAGPKRPGEAAGANGGKQTPHQRRLSLPSIIFLWPES